MEPASALKVGLSLYEAGGLALVLLALIAILVWLVGRFLFGLIGKMGARIDHLEDQQVNLLNVTVSENSAALQNLVAKTSEQTDCIKQQTEVLRQRPCLVEGQRYAQTPLPR